MSHHQQIAQNASDAISRIDSEVSQLRSQVEQLSSERDSIAAEMSALVSRKGEVIAAIEQKRAEVRRARLEADVSAGTDKQGEADAWVAQCSASLDVTLEHARQHAELEAMLPQQEGRIDYLTSCLADGHKMLAEAAASRSELSALYAKHHEAHGREVYRTSLSELAALEERAAVEKKRYEHAEHRLTGFKAHMYEKFEDWPQLQTEVRIYHAPVQDSDPYAALLRWSQGALDEIESLLAALPADQAKNFQLRDVQVGDADFWSLVGVAAPSWLRDAVYHTARKTSEQEVMRSYPGYTSFVRRRRLIGEALALLDMRSRHIDQRGLENVKKHLAEMAAPEQEQVTA